jgi:hypothetical protein
MVKEQKKQKTCVKAGYKESLRGFEQGPSNMQPVTIPTELFRPHNTKKKK